jgi:hypothetical protein
MSSHSTSLQQSVKWYRKLALEVLLGTALVNAHFLYKKIRKDDISITKCREEIVKGLLNHKNVEENSSERRTQSLSFDSFKKRVQSTWKFA